MSGLIPAHAGKTTGDGGSSAPVGAHPRSRGENPSVAARATARSGSSPLTRGKRGLHRPGPPRPGLIPAHAGKTRTGLLPPRAGPAHPRSRGENATNEDPASAYSGSSPLTRGKQGDRSGLQWRVGLIPAHAGKTHPPFSSARCIAAHPRSRGENLRLETVYAWYVGSSPLTRGKLHRFVYASSPWGLIPAHAGKTPPAMRRRLPSAAHPRSRGENYRGGVRVGPARGSSPLTRGKQRGLDTNLGAHRLIPAHAGKTPPGRP